MSYQTSDPDGKNIIFIPVTPTEARQHRHAARQPHLRREMADLLVRWRMTFALGATVGAVCTHVVWLVALWLGGVRP